MQTPFLLLGLVLFPSVASAIELTGADGLIDFDSAVGFSDPRTIKVFRSAEPGRHQYFIVPNSIRLVAKAGGSPEFALFHSGYKSNKEGYVTFSLEPVIDTADLDAVIAEIKSSDNQAKFSIPQPVASLFYLIGPSMTPQFLTVAKDAGNPLLTKSSFSAKISNIAVRASLLPTSHEYAIFTIGHDFKLRGTARDETGAVLVKERNMATSFVVQGLCSLHPQVVVNIAEGTFGCIRQNYPRSLVREIQKNLKKKGFFAGAVDGRFGAITEAAIRSFQRQAGLQVDGLPSEDLKDRLKI